MQHRKQATFVLGYAGVGQAPSASGVYTIFSSRRWVYVGESDDIRQSLYRHLNEPTPCMTKLGPLSFSFELEGRARRTALWQSLVTRLKTECNHPLSSTLSRGRTPPFMARPPVERAATLETPLDQWERDHALMSKNILCPVDQRAPGPIVIYSPSFVRST